MKESLEIMLTTTPHCVDEGAAGLVTLSGGTTFFRAPNATLEGT
jgi:hypothetical protein